MATTTNYAWETPDDTDLVKDGAAAIRTLGSSIDTTTKALNPSTTLGDIEYRSSTANTNTRLGIGSTGQVLTVAGGVPTWATAGGGGLTWTLLNTGGTALSGSSVTVSGITSENLLIILSDASSTSASAVMRLRINADTGAKYSYAGLFGTNPSTYVANATSGTSSINNTFVPLGTMDGGASSPVDSSISITGGKSTGIKTFLTLGGGQNYGAAGQRTDNYQGIYSATAALSSITILTSAGSFDTGTVYVYGA